MNYLNKKKADKIMLYQKQGEVRDAIFDLLSEDHKTQISQIEWKRRDEK